MKHKYDGADYHKYGWTIRCTCGWEHTSKKSSADASTKLRQHIEGAEPRDHREVVPAEHPAPFSVEILQAIEKILIGNKQMRGQLTLDPFAGIGYIHELPIPTVGTEIEFDWASQAKPNEHTIVADATRLPFSDKCFQQAITSPSFGNRMADHHNARDMSKRHTYHHYMVEATGHGLHDRNSGQMQWGERYRQFHIECWLELTRVVRKYFILHIGDHVRDGRPQNVPLWHQEALSMLGWEALATMRIPTRHLRHGENWDLRVEREQVILFRKRK